MNPKPITKKQARMSNLTDKQLIDWLAARSYVEATNSGYEDPRRFEFHGSSEQFRAALSNHIRGKRRRRTTEGGRMVPLDKIPLTGTSEARTPEGGPTAQDRQMMEDSLERIRAAKLLSAKLSQRPDTEECFIRDTLQEGGSLFEHTDRRGKTTEVWITQPKAEGVIHVSERALLTLRREGHIEQCEPSGVSEQRKEYRLTLRAIKG